MPEQMTKQDAIETLEIFRNDYTREGSAMCRAIDIAMDALRQQPEVRHGEWIIKPHGSYRKMRAFCSACGKHSGIGGIESNQRKPFCPNCGADMREVSEDAGTD